MHCGSLWLLGCVHHYYFFHEKSSDPGDLYCSLGRVVNFKIIYHHHFSMILYPWLSFPQPNQHPQTATIVAAIASTQLSTRNITVHISLTNLTEALNYKIPVFCLGAVTTFVVQIMLRTTYLLRPFPLTLPTLTGYRQMYALKLTTSRRDGHIISNSTTSTAASWEMLFEIGTNWSISASSRSPHRPSPIA